MAIHNFGLRASAEFFGTAHARKLFFVEFGDAVREPRNFSAGGIAVHDTFLRCTNERRLGFRHGGERAACDRRRRSLPRPCARPSGRASGATLLMTVRRALWRAAFLADLVLAMVYRIQTVVNESGAYRGAQAPSSTPLTMGRSCASLGHAFGADRVVTGDRRRRGRPPGTPIAAARRAPIAARHEYGRAAP